MSRALRSTRVHAGFPAPAVRERARPEEAASSRRIRRTHRKKKATGLATLLAAASVLLAPLPAFAVEKVWGFKGTITGYASGGGFVSLPDAPVGSVIRGQFRFDDAAGDLAPGSSQLGSYAGLSIALAIEGTSLLHFAVSTSYTIETADDVADGPDFRDTLGVIVAPGTSFSDLDLDVIDATLELSEVDSPAPTVLTSDALPATPPPLASFTTAQQLSILGYTNGMLNAVDLDATITEFEEPGTVDLPLIPDVVTVNPDGSVTWTFTTEGISICASGCWVDPPVSESFTYTMTNAALFTGIADFPTGFASDFEVSVGGSSLGTYGPGDSVDFSGYPGGGVSSFVVSGITPSADLTSAEAFPLELAFDSAVATFEMTSSAPTAVPGLGWIGGGLAVAVLSSVLARARRRTARA